ncbi:MAG TPA: tetratricopeptide repeat protein [Thermoanaerobaculia bacterium]|nr:tetratricopeptide repeat protein [Thermoanaerobaculia bacterium]
MRLLRGLAILSLVCTNLQAATPEQLFAAGKQALIQNDAEKAVDLLEQAVDLRPNNSEYHFWLGRAYGTLAQNASIFRQPFLAGKTKTQFERAVELDPNNNDARFGLISFYLIAPSIAGGSEEKAIRQATEIRKRDALDGHRAFARIYSSQKKPDLARKEYLDAVREQPASPNAHCLMATVWMSEKKWKEALDELDTSLKLDAAYMPAFFRIGQLAVLASDGYTRGEESLRKYLGWRPGEQDPPLYRAWYWLGQIYEKQGRKADAKQCYAASLKLNPSQKDVSEALKRFP